MNEFTSTAIFLLVDSAIVALAVEGLKKTAGEMTLTEAGHWRIKTVLQKSSIVLIAVLLSLIFVSITYLGGALYGNKILIALYSVVVFAGQYFIDMALIKKLAEKLIIKFINKI